jgi:putative thioredoxin
MDGFPFSKEYAVIETLRPLASALAQNSDPYTGPAAEDDSLEVAYRQALRLIGRGNIPAAMDGILDILRQDKRYRAGEAHKVLLALFELLGEQSELTRQYRSELVSILF